MIFSTLWNVQFEFSTLKKLLFGFSITREGWLKISTKLEVKKNIFHTVQGEYSAVIALKCFATESCIQLIRMPLYDEYRTFCHAENVENHA